MLCRAKGAPTDGILAVQTCTQCGQNPGVSTGETLLAEARDRVAIRKRKKQHDTGVSYFTRSGMRYLKK